MLDTLPLNDEPICDRCQTAFWRNMGLPVRDDPLPQGQAQSSAMQNGIPAIPKRPLSKTYLGV
jgi:hypothetical protein